MNRSDFVKNLLTVPLWIKATLAAAACDGPGRPLPPEPDSRKTVEEPKPMAMEGPYDWKTNGF